MDLSADQIIIVIAVLALSISVHESMHSFVAYALGDRTSHDLGRFSLNPLNHIDPLTTIALPLLLITLGAPPFAAAKPVPIDTTRLKWDEWGMALVSAAGPLSNLALAVLASFLLRLAGSGASEVLQSGLLYAVSINVGLGIFNLIPFPPLDGSRLLYAIAPDGLRGLMLKIEQMGFAAIIFFMFIIFPFLSGTLLSVNKFFLNLFL
jgi:Zn-dependent protease